MKILKKNAGLSLIEILLGIVISSIMIAAMYTTYTVVNNSYSQVTDVAQISRSGRDIISMLMRDIRMAGFKYFYGYNAENEAKGESKIPREDYLNFVAGDTDGTRKDSHAPIVIYKNTRGYDGVASDKTEGDKYLPIDQDGKIKTDDSSFPDVCCDRIHIVYGDFDALDTDQPYKRYRITYFAKPMKKKISNTKSDDYYAIYRSLESWIQKIDETEPDSGYWATEGDGNCAECYNEELIREYLVDMEFLALGKDGTQIGADPVDDQDTMFDIRAIDVRLTFRSSTAKGFFRTTDLGSTEELSVDGTTTNRNIGRIVKSLGNRTVAYFDKFLRDSVVVTVHTRNIGEMF